MRIFILWMLLFQVGLMASPKAQTGLAAGTFTYAINSYIKTSAIPVTDKGDRGAISLSSTAIKSFEVIRTKTKVDLLWVATKEKNSNGFEIQRRALNGEWEKVAFVFHQDIDESNKGNLTYEYTDVNIYKQETEYRLQQVDNNRKLIFSEIKKVPGRL